MVGSRRICRTSTKARKVSRTKPKLITYRGRQRRSSGVRQPLKSALRVLRTLQADATSSSPRIGSEVATKGRSPCRGRNSWHLKYSEMFAQTPTEGKTRLTYGIDEEEDHSTARRAANQYARCGYGLCERTYCLSIGV